jgi:hypothetical protein
MRLAGYGLEDAYAEQPDMGVIRRHGTLSDPFKYQPRGIRSTAPTPRPMSAMSPSTNLTAPKFHFRSSPDNVAKVENRTIPKISRMLIFRRLCRCNALSRRCDGPWSILYETMWSLTSPRTKRIGGPKKFCSSPKKDFCNNICQLRTQVQVRQGGREAGERVVLSVSCPDRSARKPDILGERQDVS